MECDSPILDSPALEAVLSQHNRRWCDALSTWHARSGVRWTPGMVADHDLRMTMETYLPWKEFAVSLRAVARQALPSLEWIPVLLREGFSEMETILDFWEELGEPFRGRCGLQKEELLTFFCACADPPRFGTTLGRYPQQLEQLPRCRSLLDLGCGVGLGTLEAARRTGAERVLGVTSEPLEVWMASHRRLPHDPRRNALFPQFDAIPAEFQTANILEFRPHEQYDLILCNGLAGGRFLHRPEDLEKFLDLLDSALTPHGTAALANAFHTGWQTTTEDLLHRATKRGWNITGSWRCAFARRKKAVST